MSNLSGTLKIIRGDDVTITVTFTDSDGDAIDITGATVFFTVKNDLADTDASALISKDITSHTDPTQGQTQIVIAAADTNDLTPGTYFWDIQKKSASGSIQSGLYGRFKIYEDVTRRTS